MPQEGQYNWHKKLAILVIFMIRKAADEPGALIEPFPSAVPNTMYTELEGYMGTRIWLTTYGHAADKHTRQTEIGARI
jgi:hypothetical protein